ncbi:MAG: transcriptional regulator, GntR family [Bradyrhizobium sp.]|nr:transcriptional regulator, GntR family [Bradyrhizobium sp.]
MSDDAFFPPDDGDAATDTKAERAAAVLQRAVLTGELAPGSKLRVNDLMKAYGIGATPLREGLSRLVAAGFVEANSQRGFRVVPISRSDLEDIIRTRTLVEIEALRLSMENGDDAWEANIVAALYRLNKAGQGHGEGAPEGGLTFDSVHKGFHMALIAACGSPRLLEMSAMLFDQTFRYRQIVRDKLMPHRPSQGDHKLIAESVIARDFATASDLLRQHLRVTGTLAEGRQDLTNPRRKKAAKA